MYTQTVTQPISVGQQKVPNQHYTTHFSPTKNMHPHPPMGNHIHSPPHSNASGPDSIPSPPTQFQFEKCPNQSLSDAMKSISSGSSLESGGDSVGGASSGEASSGTASSKVDPMEEDSRSPEILYPISDRDDEETAISDVASINS